VKDLTAIKKKLLSDAGGLALAGLLSIGVFVMALGLLRYGGVEGVYQRVAARLDVRAPHPEYVPTPFTDPSGQPETAALLSIASPTAALTAAPTAAPTPTQIAASQVAHAGRPATFGEEINAPVARSTPAAPATAAPTRTPALPAAHRLEGLSHYWQTWNNCGPATLAMNLSYFKLNVTQEQVRLALRPEKDDKNVNPEEMAAYARSQGLNAVARVNGDSQKLRALLLAGVPVLAETWYEPKPNDGMGHYRLLVGYEDAAKEWIAFDSYESHGLDRKAPYSGIRLNYSEFDRLWQVFSRAYVVIYDKTRAEDVEAIIGSDMDDAAMWQRSLGTAQAAVGVNAQNAFAWFNIGTAMTAQGDYANAAAAFDHARRLKLPWRMLWYQFAPFHAYYEVGRYDEVISLTNATLSTAKNVEELYYWRGMAEKAKGDIEAARASWQKALQLQPSYPEANAAFATLP
jgi:tetratricopeptide (TPR) repeat protein